MLQKICWAPLRLCVFCVFAAIPAHADLLLNYIGVTAAGSSLAGNPIALGTQFEINASFPDAMTPITTGIAVANTDSITIEVGGVSYSAIPGSGYSYVDFYDPANPAFAGVYAAGLYVTGGGFDPEYTAATPPLNALNPADTVFSGFLGDISPSASLPFETLAGLLVVTYDPGTSLAASITSPEPGTFVLLGAALAGIALLLRRNYPLRHQRESR